MPAIAYIYWVEPKISGGWVDELLKMIGGVMEVQGTSIQVYKTIQTCAMDGDFK